MHLGSCAVAANRICIQPGTGDSLKQQNPDYTSWQQSEIVAPAADKFLRRINCCLGSNLSLNLRDFDLSDAPSRHPLLRPLRSEGERWRAAGDWPLTATSRHLLGTYWTYWGYPGAPGRMVSRLHVWWLCVCVCVCETATASTAFHLPLTASRCLFSKLPRPNLTSTMHAMHFSAVVTVLLVTR